MKQLKFFLLLITFTILCSNTSLYAQWYEKSDGLPSNWGAWVIDAYDSLIAVGPIANDSIYITTDGGNNWYPRHLPPGVDDISIIGSEKIWFCNGWGEIYATDDGGFNWKLQFYDTSMTKFMNYIEMFDSLNGIAMGDAPANDKPALFLKTSNGGSDWISQNDSTLIGLYSGDIWRRIDFIDINTGYFFASGENPQKVYKTTNGGKDWVSVNDSIYCMRIKFYDENIGLAVQTFGNATSFYRTLDGGTEWEFISLNENLGWASDIEFISGQPSNVWFITSYSVNTSSGLFFSSDTGRTWVQQSYPLNWSFYDIVFTDDQNGWLLGGDSWNYHIFRTTNGGSGGLISVDDNQSNNILSNFILEQNYPNPFNPTTSIKYQIPELSFVTIKVFDVLGREVATLVNEENSTGSYKILFNAENLSSGIYFYQLRAGNFIQTKKMLLIK